MNECIRKKDGDELQSVVACCDAVLPQPDSCRDVADLVLHDALQELVVSVSPHHSLHNLERVKLQKLGQGGYGTVDAVRNLLDNRECAVKSIVFSCPKGEQFHDKACREVDAMQALVHSPYVVKYIDSNIRSLPNESLRQIVTHLVVGLSVSNIAKTLQQVNAQPQISAIPPLPLRPSSANPGMTPRKRNPVPSSRANRSTAPTRRHSRPAPLLPIEVTTAPASATIITSSIVEHPTTPPSGAHPSFPTLFPSKCLSPYPPASPDRPRPSPTNPTSTCLPPPLFLGPPSTCPDPTYHPPPPALPPLTIPSDSLPPSPKAPNHFAPLPTSSGLNALVPRRPPPTAAAAARHSVEEAVVQAVLKGARSLISPEFLVWSMMAMAQGAAPGGGAPARGPVARRGRGARQRPSDSDASDEEDDDDAEPCSGSAAAAADDGRRNDRAQRLRRRRAAAALLSQLGGKRLYELQIKMEWVRGPTLKQWLVRRNAAGAAADAGACTGERELALARQLVRGLHDIHQAGYLHRDFKPDNIFLQPQEPPSVTSPTASSIPPASSSYTPPPADFLTSPTTPPTAQLPASAPSSPQHRTPPPSIDLDTSYQVKIGDFGLAVKYPSDSTPPSPSLRTTPPPSPGTTPPADTPPFLTSSPPSQGSGTFIHKPRSSVELTAAVGTPSYAAPEVKRGSRYGPSADLYSLGLICLEIFCPLTTGHARAKAFSAARSSTPTLPEAFEKAAPQLAALIRSLLHPKPSQRPTTHHLLSHPLLFPSPLRAHPSPPTCTTSLTRTTSAPPVTKYPNPESLTSSPLLPPYNSSPPLASSPPVPAPAPITPPTTPPAPPNTPPSQAPSHPSVNPFISPQTTSPYPLPPPPPPIIARPTSCPPTLLNHHPTPFPSSRPSPPSTTPAPTPYPFKPPPTSPTAIAYLSPVPPPTTHHRQRPPLHHPPIPIDTTDTNDQSPCSPPSSPLPNPIPDETQCTTPLEKQLVSLLQKLQGQLQLTKEELTAVKQQRDRLLSQNNALTHTVADSHPARPPATLHE